MPRTRCRNWRVTGYVGHARDWFRENIRNHTETSFKEVLYQFVCLQNGEIDEVVETRENWKDLWSHHYDLRPTIGGKNLYIETRLHYQDPEDADDPVIYIVNIHLA